MSGFLPIQESSTASKAPVDSVMKSMKSFPPTGYHRQHQKDFPSWAFCGCRVRLTLKRTSHTTTGSLEREKLHHNKWQAAWCSVRMGIQISSLPSSWGASRNVSMSVLASFFISGLCVGAYRILKKKLKKKQTNFHPSGESGSVKTLKVEQMFKFNGLFHNLWHFSFYLVKNLPFILYAWPCSCQFQKIDLKF